MSSMKMIAVIGMSGMNAEICPKSIQMANDMKHHGSSAIYGLGLIGAAIYYITTATGFWMGVLGLVKALFWPAFLVYEALKAVGA